MTVVGGIYRERCLHPAWNAVYGSAGRAAQTISALVPGRRRLQGYVSERTRPEVELLAQLAECELVATPAPFDVTFDYSHTLANPTISPPPGFMQVQPSIKVSDEIVLRYGMLEGDAVVTAQTAIYDPQSAFGGTGYKSNGSSARRLAVVLNRLEMQNITGQTDPLLGAQWFWENDGAEVVVLKMGARGAKVITREGKQNDVPLYRTKSVWKLGSGDVFSATFAALWGANGMDPTQAADIASRSVAWYCEHRSLPPPAPDTLLEVVNKPLSPGTGRVYLAGPFFDLGQRWVIEEARRALLAAGVEVFSPIHEVGPGTADVVAPADIAGLEGCQIALAVLSGTDPGTLFELGYANKLGLPIVALAENVREEDLKMVAGTGALVTDDFATAIYQTIWGLGT